MNSYDLASRLHEFMEDEDKSCTMENLRFMVHGELPQTR